jgi:transcription termination/antitermination protein NusG
MSGEDTMNLTVNISSSATAKRWLAVFTVPRHEKRVQEYLRTREVESFLPLCQVRRQWKDGSKQVLQLPLFSNYIFVRVARADCLPVLTIPGVISIVGGGREYSSIPDSYIQFLQEGLRQGKIEPHPCFSSGTKVRIRSGIMAGMEGILLRQKSDCRVVLTLEMIMKSVKVEVKAEDIEPIDGACYSRWPQAADVA